MSEQIACPYCTQPAELVGGNAIYPNRPDLFAKFFWRCEPCKAWVGCHPPVKHPRRPGKGDGTVPMGRLANDELRKLKQRAHAAFDPLWKNEDMTRRQAYEWLAEQLGIPVESCHIGMMDESECRAVIKAVEYRNRDRCAPVKARHIKESKWHQSTK